MSIMGSTEQHYSLRWNDYTVKIVTAFQSLRDEEDFVDVTVACDGHHYSAHKMVLSACSPYFRALLRANPCQHPIVILKDVGHIEMERLLEFMYNGEVNIAQDQLAAFLKTAENLKIRGLAGSSEDMDHLHNKDSAIHTFSTVTGSTPVTGTSSGRNSPVGPKEEETTLDSVTYHARLESPPSKRRKRSNVPPATSHSDSNAASHASDGLVSDGGVELTGGVGGLDDDLRLIDRREMKPEPSDPLAECYADDLPDGDGRTALYPMGIAGPSGATTVGTQDNLSPQEPGAPGTACEALNLSLRPTTNGMLLAPPTLPPPLHHPSLQRSVATTVISHSNGPIDCHLVDQKPQQLIELVYPPEMRFSLPISDKLATASHEMVDRGSIVAMESPSSVSSEDFKSKTYPCQECHKVFRHPMSLHHHRHVHKGTYTCDSCGKVFSRRWDLHRHMHRSKMGCRRPSNHGGGMPPHCSNSSITISPHCVPSGGVMGTHCPSSGGLPPHCPDFTLDLNNPPSN